MDDVDFAGLAHLGRSPKYIKDSLNLPWLKKYPKTIEGYAEKFGGNLYSRAKEMIEDGKPDALCICTEDYLHQHYDLLAVRNGLHAKGLRSGANRQQGVIILIRQRIVLALLISLCFILIPLHICKGGNTLNSQENSRSVFDIIDFGAVPDAQTLNTDAIQKAIDACTATGGGQVYVGPGVYLTGTIFLKDNVTLYLEAGATLLGSPRIEDYKPKSVVMAQGSNNIGIEGRGTIDGQGHEFWERQDPERIKSHGRRKFSWVPHFYYRHGKQTSGMLVRVIDCTDVRISDVVMKNSESWTLLILGCDDVNVRGLRILNPLIGPNTDGIDIEASSNVTVSDCYIYTADDAICLKNNVKEYTDRVCRNITITNCILTTVCNAFKIGTGTRGSFENIVFSNSIIKAGEPSELLAESALETIDSDHYGNALGPLGGIAIETVDGGYLRGIAVSNIVMKGVRAPIFIRRANRASKNNPHAVPGILKDVTIDNIVAYGASTTSSISGLPEYPVENISLSNISIEIEGGGTEEMAKRELPELPTTYPESSMWGRLPSHGLFCRHVDGLVMNNVRIMTESPDARPLLICDDVSSLRISGIKSDSSVTAEYLISFADVRDAVVKGMIPPMGTKTWIRVIGDKSANILLMPDDLRNAERPIHSGDEVPSNAVQLRAE